MTKAKPKIGRPKGSGLGHYTMSKKWQEGRTSVPPDGYVTVAAAAALAKVSPWTIRNSWSLRGQIRTKRIGSGPGSFFVHLGDVKAKARAVARGELR